ncbi:MAG: rRNA maturation RNase YbeY [Clostridia bacterium]|nr:rRNA maturation RNase YbeY [Clostridia bacterium]
MTVKVNIFNKQKKIPITPAIRALIRKTCATVLKNENFPGAALVDVSIVDDGQIKLINNECRGIDAATDVLSFPLGENGVYDTDPKTGAFMLGDIVLSIEHAIAQGELYGHGQDREIAYLTVHSMLHLLGYDHINSKSEKALMREHEEAAMQMLGLTVKGE